MSLWTVLFVDDELDVVSSLRRELEGAVRASSVPPCRVLTCTDPLGALAIVEREEVDVLVADLQMPGITGIELLAQARERFPSVARIVVTGSSSAKSAIDAINTGRVLRYIQKPWGREEVREAIAEAIDWVERARREEERHSTEEAREAVREELTTSWPSLLNAVLVDGVRVIDPARCRATASSLDAAALLAALDPPTRS